MWDVVEEHLDEAAFMLELRDDAMDSPAYTLDGLISGPEQRFRAHIDGLVIGGPEVATTLLHPTIEEGGDDDPYRVAAAASALLATPQPLVSQPLLDGIAAYEPEIAQAVGDAIALAERSDLDARLQSAWGRADAEAQRVLLPILRRRALDPGRALDTLLRHDDPQVRAEALTAARFSDRARYLAWVEQAVLEPDPAIATAATTTGLVFGSMTAWEAVSRRARDAKAVDRDALTYVATFGDPNVVALLRERVASGVGKAEAVWAL